MIDRIFFAALTFSLLASGTLAIGSALFEGRPGAPLVEKRVVPLPVVETHIVRLPAVDVSGNRQQAGTTVARTSGSEPAASNVQ